MPEFITRANLASVSTLHLDEMELRRALVPEKAFEPGSCDARPVPSRPFLSTIFYLSFPPASVLLSSIHRIRSIRSMLNISLPQADWVGVGKIDQSVSNVKMDMHSNVIL